MNGLQVWAPNAQSVELVTKDKASFSPPVILQKTTVTYRGNVLPGYWQTPPGTAVLQDGDGYWFLITFDNGEQHYRVDPYARAMNNSVSYSIYKDPARFQWTDGGRRRPPRGQMVI